MHGFTTAQARGGAPMDGSSPEQTGRSSAAALERREASRGKEIKASSDGSSSAWKKNNGDRGRQTRPNGQSSSRDRGIVELASCDSEHEEQRQDKDQTRLQRSWSTSTGTRSLI